MKRLIAKSWFLTTTLCLLAMFSTLFVGIGNQQRVSEEISSQLVDILEKFEVVSQRSEGRVSRKRNATPALNLLLNDQKLPGVRPGCSFFSPVSERDCLNGLGTYLRT